MRLHEAIESGKRFRRKSWRHLSWFTNLNGVIVVKDAIADDWEVEQPAKQKVTMWQVVYENPRGGFYMSGQIFKGEAEAREYCGCDKFIKLVNPIEIEVDI